MHRLQAQRGKFLPAAVFGMFGMFGVFGIIGATAAPARADFAPAVPPPGVPGPGVPAPGAPVVGAPAVGAPAVDAPALGLRISVGTRSDLVRSRGLDPFSTSDQLAQSAVAVGYTVAASGHRSFALGLEWDHGSTTSTARAAIADLKLNRFSLVIEGRLQPAQRLGLFARVAPSLLHDRVTLTDGSAPVGAFAGGGVASLEQATWVAAADASAGVAVQVFELPRAHMAGVGFWLSAEGGYGYSRAHQLVLKTGAEVQPGRTDEPVRLGELALSGLFARATVGLSF